MTRERRFRVMFRNRQFALLWSGQAVSLFGDGILALALPLLVIQTHHGATELGLVVAARMVPLVVLLMFGGAITDRISRRVAMLVADGARGVTTLLLGVLAATNRLDFAELIVGAILLGTFDALFLPASTAMIPDIVDTEMLQTANSLTQISRTLAPVLGPVVAGFIAAKWALMIDGATFAVSACFLAAMHPTPKVKAGGGSMLAEIKEGLVFCRRTPWIWWTLLVAGVANAFVFTPSSILVILLLVHVLESPQWQIGVVLAVASLGGVLGAVVAGRRRLPTHRIRVMWLAWTSACLVFACVGFAPAAWVVAGLLFIGSPLLFYGSIIWESMLQAEVPRELLGRVSSVDWLISLGISPIGVAIAGVVAGTIGVRVTIIVPALAVSIFALMVLLFVPQLSAIDKRAQVLGADEAASA